jgi:phosphoribulokinase
MNLKKKQERRVKVIRNFKPQGKTVPFKGPESIDSDCLECFEYEYTKTNSGRNMELSRPQTSLLRYVHFQVCPILRK